MKTSTKTQPAGRLNILSARAVQAAGDGDHSDGGGLYLRVRGTSASWVYRYTASDGRRREMGFGAVQRNNPKATGESLTGARDAAAEARKVRQSGRDPIEARAQTKAAEAASITAAKTEKRRERLTLARVARDYHAAVIEPRRTTKHAAQWIASLENHIPGPLWHKPIADIEPPELLEALTSIKPHSRARNLPTGIEPTSVVVHETIGRIRQRLEAVFEHGQFLKLCSGNPAQAIKRKLAEHLPERKRGAFASLDYRQAPALLARLRQAQGTAARCLEFAVLTASRTSEALLAEWSEIDLDAGTFSLIKERMKASRPHTVFLPPRAIEVLRGQVGQDSRYVFPSTQQGHEGKPMSNMALLVTLDRLGVRKLTTVHGLCRATFSTWANETGAARPDVIESCLAHEEENKVRAAYNRATFDAERKALLASWADYLGSTGQVVRMPQRAA